jgi:hypothetical protein
MEAAPSAEDRDAAARRQAAIRQAQRATRQLALESGPASPADEGGSPGRGPPAASAPSTSAAATAAEGGSGGGGDGGGGAGGGGGPRRRRRRFGVLMSEDGEEGLGAAGAPAGAPLLGGSQAREGAEEAGRLLPGAGGAPGPAPAPSHEPPALGGGLREAGPGPAAPQLQQQEQQRQSAAAAARGRAAPAPATLNGPGRPAPPGASAAGGAGAGSGSAGGAAPDRGGTVHPGQGFAAWTGLGAPAEPPGALLLHGLFGPPQPQPGGGAPPHLPGSAARARAAPAGGHAATDDDAALDALYANDALDEELRPFEPRARFGVRPASPPAHALRPVPRVADPFGGSPR